MMIFLDLDLIYLEAGRLYAAIAEQVSQPLAVEVADPNVPDQPLVVQALHGGPGLADGHLGKLHPRVGGRRIVKPFGRVSNFEWDKLEGDGKVDEVKIQVV